MEDTQDLIFEIEGNVGSVGSSDLLGVVSLVMTGGTEALHLGKTSDSFEQQTGKKAKTVSRSLARTTTNIWETGNKKILRQVYSNHLPVERPTPKNFIIRLAEYLKRQTIRKQDTPLNGLERNETIPKEPNVHQMFFTNIFSTRYIHPALPPMAFEYKVIFQMAAPQFLWFLPLSHGKNAVALLVKKDSRLQLPPEHLLDVVHDFLSQEVILS